jgi:hypothetical protein
VCDRQMVSRLSLNEKMLSCILLRCCQFRGSVGLVLVTVWGDPQNPPARPPCRAWPLAERLILALIKRVETCTTTNLGPQKERSTGWTFWLSRARITHHPAPNHMGVRKRTSYYVSTKLLSHRVVFNIVGARFVYLYVEASVFIARYGASTACTKINSKAQRTR